MDYLFKDRDCNWYKFEISENLIGYFKDYFNSDLYSDYHPITFFNIIKYFIKNNIKFDINNVFDYYKSELVHNEIGPVLTLKDNRSALFNRGIVTSYQNYYLDKILEIYIDGKYTMEEKLFL
ncbi:hypothetical protein NAPIS_ORF00167 [Vairimorpha apis BRL 01]|uniref:Uncharacterized protein n=1 Tax=Vairimorpha apis BRL 01 TaxID=1037528 RepID=T0MML3_9MICR|nr:hypothetical protein NAPIS_ORF00167 [Vairimorpha apis BRL 01]